MVKVICRIKALKSIRQGTGPGTFISTFNPSKRSSRENFHEKKINLIKWFASGHSGRAREIERLNNGMKYCHLTGRRAKLNTGR